MRELIELANEAFAADETCILCSVVRLQGSGYGRIGARLLVTQSGQRVGYISGGCLERDLSRRVWSEAVGAPRLMAFDTRGQSPASSRYNTGCRGIVTVLCQPLRSTDAPFYRIASNVIERRQSTQMITVYHSTSRDIRVGDCLAMFEDGTLDGSPHLLSDHDWARGLLNHHEPCYTATITDTAGNAQIEVSVETLRPPTRLVIFGSGSDVQPVVDIARGQGWDVCVVGNQPISGASRTFAWPLHRDNASTMPQSHPIDAHTHVLLMTHDLSRDVEALSWLLQTPAKSIGSLGSKSRLGRVVAELYNRGHQEALANAAQIRCPIGLGIGAIGPAEIALSIMSELIAIERNQAVPALSEQSGSVHQTTPHLEIPLPFFVS